MSAKLGHRIVDFPEILERSFTFDDSYKSPPIPVIFLFKAPSSFREELLQRMKHQDDNHWPATVTKRDLCIVPWLRNFTPSIHDVSVFDNECILVDKQLLEKDKCIVSHLIRVPDVPLNTDVYEYAIVAIADAYKLLCFHSAPDSWFDGTLDATCRFEPVVQPNAQPDEDAKNDSENDSETESDTEAEETPNTNLPIFVLPFCTSEQEEQLEELLTCDFMEPEFFHVPITLSSSSEISVSYHDKKIDVEVNKESEKEGGQSNTANQVMQYLLSRSWFPIDFVVVDETTLSSPYFTCSIEQKTPQYLSFLYGARLCIWHAGPHGRLIASDTVGYAINRVQIKGEDDYGMWCGAMIKGMGLGHWVEDEEAWERCYWSCWVDENGRLDEEVQADPEVD
jgi:hypothetical protein